ncbi:NAD(P)-dependent dehydrogenase (short-subunit alcohol dehydrogenase family) [Luteimonas sp. J16]|jgi:NAD(P)-dependent dehydrogenase (short-subunit alcohol dehydrogenase family)|uniref:SDR family oxidoreductase n=1 Tax=unclassified Luteimonas TaxID=2629088 RepID=UPI00047B0C4E|nr:MULTISPECIES: SDR family oxidoreductase [unclassified Luteimonas]TWG93655.1 NAD(P)-dependent dehydrogenase (short-subunit alcohol dehydrogenase family) [Luteimonas sp. J16]
MSRRHALVTGANRGLGLEFARQLLAAGDHVVAACRHPGKATALNALAGEHPGRLHVLPLDLAQPRTHQELARELPLVLGDDARLGLLVNNAGILHPGERFGSLAAAGFEDSFRTNALGPLLLTQALAPLLGDGARVANLSSSLGSIALTARFGTPSYCMSKAALNMATVQLAHALAGRGIVVVAISPGWVRTDMGGAGAELDPAQAVAGMLRVIDGLGSGDSGRFLDWQGDTLAW